MGWDIQTLRDIDRQIADAMRRSDVRYMKLQYHIRSLEERIGMLSVRMAKMEQTKPPLLGSLANSLWLKVAILLLLLAANVSFEHSTKLLSLLR